MTKFVRWGALAALGCLLILMLGPFQGAERSFDLSDKSAHALAFAVITSALFLNWLKASRLQVVGASFAIAVLVEVVQAMTGRDAEVGDVLADSVGIIIVAVLWGLRRVV